MTEQQSQVPTGGLIHQKICEVMTRVGAIAKSQQNKEQGFKFRGIDDVHNALQQVLAEVGVHYTPEVLDGVETFERERVGGKKSYHTFMRVRFTFFAADGSSFSAVTRGEGLDHGGDKSSNKAMSAAEKYALLQVFCVATQEQEDADRHSPNMNEDGQGKDPAPQQPPRSTGRATPPAGRGAKPVDGKPTEAQLRQLEQLMNAVQPDDATINGWFDKASAAAGKQLEAYDEMKASTVAGIIRLLIGKQKAAQKKPSTR